jgi:hypothetical protein
LMCKGLKMVGNRRLMVLDCKSPCRRFDFASRHHSRPPSAVGFLISPTSYRDYLGTEKQQFLSPSQTSNHCPPAFDHHLIFDGKERNMPKKA